MTLTVAEFATLRSLSDRSGSSRTHRLSQSAMAPMAGRQQDAALSGGQTAIVRVASVRAKQGQAAALIEAARANADAARSAPGCRSAEVCRTPESAGRILVISRWASESSLQDFLDWHEQLAHHSLSAFCEGKPHWVHYPVVAPSPHDPADDV